MTSKSVSWPSRFLGPVPKLRDLSFIVWGLLLVGFVLPFSIIVVHNGRPPDADLVGFYSMGRILNEHSAHDLYNFDLQKQICFEVQPRQRGYGPLPYPPYLGVFFRPIALLPYWTAYLLWILTSIALYAFGIRFAVIRFLPASSRAYFLIFALAFAYCPFIAYTVANGQLSAVGFFGLSLASREDDRGERFNSGLALTLCLFKPTLLVLIVPMLLVTCRLRTLAGLSSGASLLAAITTVLEGFSVWPDYIGATKSFASDSLGLKTHSFLPLSKYVDLTSFSSLAQGGRTWPALVTLLMVCCCAAIALLIFWKKAPHRGRAYNALLWATTLTWTLLLNVYVPIYDSILIVLSAILTVAALKQLGGRSIHAWFTAIWVLILVCSWFTVPVSDATGIQLVTLLLMALGTLQFAALKKLADLSADRWPISLQPPCADTL